MSSSQLFTELSGRDMDATSGMSYVYSLESLAAALEAALLLSLFAMFSIRKLGPAVADAWLVPHRSDIGRGLVWTVVVCSLVSLGKLPKSLAPCGDLHIALLIPQQFNFIMSVVRRGEMNKRHPLRICILIAIYAGFAYAHVYSMARLSVALNAASLWAVQLRLRGGDKAA